MSVNTIDLGAAPNDHTGTPARSAGQIINDNFIYLDGKISNKNQIVTYGTFALVGQVLTIHAGWVWLINGQQFTNPVDVEIMYPFAASGKQRLDRVVFNTSNTFSRIAGPESETNPFAPAPLPDTIEFGVNLITDNSVGDPSSPVIGDNYVEKLESQDFVVAGSTLVVEQINLIDNRNSVSITGSVTDVKSVQLAAQFIRPGKPHFFKNRTGHNVKIWHNAGTGNIKYFFPNALDLVVKNGEVIQFNLNSSISNNLKFEFVGIIGVDFSEQKVLDTVMTGFVSGAGTTAATDKLLQFLQKIDGNIFLRALDSAVIHTTGNESRTGQFNFRTTSNANQRVFVNPDAGTIVIYNTAGTICAQLLNTGASQGSGSIGSAAAYIYWRQSGPVNLGASIPFVVPNATDATHAMNKGQVDALFLTGSATLDFPSTPAGTSNEITFTLTGAAVGDVISLGIPTASENPNSYFSARVSAVNTVAVKFNNYSAAAIDPASGLFKVKIFK